MGTVGKKLKKYSKGFKLSAVEDILVSMMGLRETTRKYGITHKMIQTWIKIYLDKGKSYFQDKIGDVGEVSQGFPATFLNDSSGGLVVSKRGFKLSIKDEEQLDEPVRKELNRLRMENEYLKKLNALVRKKEKPRTRKKLKS